MSGLNFNFQRSWRGFIWNPSLLTYVCTGYAVELGASRSPLLAVS